MSQKHYDELVHLAAEAGFPECDFTEAEKKLFGSVANGHEVDCKEDPEEQRTVRAELFEWVMIDREAAEHHHHRGVSLARAIFPDGFNLSDAKIKVPLRLHRCDFRCGLLLANVHLPSLNLSASQINRGNRCHAIDADSIYLDGDACLQALKVVGGVRLIGASIAGEIDLRDSDLKNEKDCALTVEAAHVGHHIYLCDAKAAGAVSLFAVRIGKHLAFARSEIRPIDISEDAIDLEGASIGGRLDFFDDSRDANTASQAKVQGRINLRNAKVGTLHDWPKLNAPGSSVPQLRDAPVIALDGFTYDRIGRHSPVDAKFRRAWLELGRKAGGGFAPQPYTQLAKVLRDMGHPREATKVLYEREKRQLSEDEYPPVERKLRKLFLGELLGYGYYPWRAVLPLLAFWVVGWHVFMVGWKHELFKPTAARVYTTYVESEGVERPRYEPFKEMTDTKLPSYPAFNSWVYSIDALLPVVDLQQESYWIPTRWCRTYLWFHIALGWVFTTLLLAGLAGVVRRPAE